MESIRKLLILAVGIGLAVLLGPMVVRLAFPSWVFDRDLENGRVSWKPVYGVLIERELGANLWEQFIVDWIGPGTIQAVQYVVTPDSDLLSNDGAARQRVGTEEMRVTLNVARMYSLARSPDEFPIIIRQHFESNPNQGGKQIDSAYGSIYLAEYAAVELQRPYRWGFKKLGAGDKVYLNDRRWSSLEGDGPGFRSMLSRGQYAGFTVFKNLRLSRPFAPEDRIESLKQIMLQSARNSGGEAPADNLGTVVELDRAPDNAAAAAAFQRLLRTADWTFPLPDDLDLAALVPAGERDSGILLNAVGVGWCYSFPMELMPAHEAMWFLRSLQQTEIAVPYTAPF